MYSHVETEQGVFTTCFFFSQLQVGSRRPYLHVGISGNPEKKDVYIIKVTD